MAPGVEPIYDEHGHGITTTATVILTATTIRTATTIDTATITSTAATTIRR